MGRIETATQWMINLANNDSHGYDQDDRWGPDYDCSSAIITAWEQAGVPVKSNGATYTGDMRGVFMGCGFSDVTSNIAISNGSGLKRGDVLLNTAEHTAMFIGNGQIVHASCNEFGGAHDGQIGDQTGGEICVRSYYNKPWDCILRYTLESGGEITPPTTNWKAAGTATCTADEVSVRATPDGTILGTLNKGNRFEIDGKKSGVWVHVKISGLGIGYVHKDYVKNDKTTGGTTGSTWKAKGTATCTADNISVKASPSGAVKGTLNKGNRFEVDGKKTGNWVHVKIVGLGIGYVHKNYVKYDKTTGGTTGGTTGSTWKAKGTATCTDDEVNVRATPNGKVKGTLNSGNRFEIDGKKSGEWIHIKVTKLGIGYIHKDYIKYDK